MVAGNLAELGFLGGTDICCELATGAESAAAGWIERRRKFAGVLAQVVDGSMRIGLWA
jgi:hypothetical protein